MSQESGAHDVPPDATPAKKWDQFIWALRGLSMMLVVFVHYFGTQFGPDGRTPEPPNFSPAVEYASWAVAWVVPVFFMAAGAFSLRPSIRVTWRAWVRSRAKRLLIPYYVFVAIMLPINIVLLVVDPDLCPFKPILFLTWIMPMHADCLGSGAPLWFLQILIPILIVAPIGVWLYRSKLRVPALIAGFGLIVLFDYYFYHVHRGRLNPLGLVAIVDLYVFYGFAFYLGFFYIDGYARRFRRYCVPIAAALSLLVAAMLAWGPYPPISVGTSATNGNQFPPSLAWLVAAAAGFFWLYAADHAIERWSRRPFPARSVTWFAERSLTILIWHMTGYICAYWFLRATGILRVLDDALPDDVLRLVMVAIALIPMFPLVNLFYPIEVRLGGKRRTASPATPSEGG